MAALICVAGLLLLCLPRPLDFPTADFPQSFFSLRGALPQQAPAPGGFTIRSVTTHVTVDAVVRTDKGGFASNLHAEDFVVYDNGIAQDVTLFSREELPLAVALVVDRSPSIQPYLAQLQSAALTALERLKPEDEVTLFSFDMNSARLSVLTRDRQIIARMVSGLPKGIGTNIYDALFDAASYLHVEAPERRRAVVLVSDNYQSAGSAHNDRETLRELLESAVVLYSIKTAGDNQGASGFGSPRIIAGFARETGGDVLPADTLSGLEGALDAALLNIKSGYVLGFTPSNPGEEGSFHRLEVRLSSSAKCPKCRVQARTAYYAGAHAPAAARSSPRSPAKPRLPGMSDAIDLEQIVAGQRIAAARNYEADLNDISFEVGTLKVQDAKGKPEVKIALRVDAANIFFRLVGARHAARLRITAFYADSKGKPLGADWKIMDLNLLESTYLRVQASGIPFSTTVPLKGPGQIIKVIVYDPWSDRLGSRVVRVD